MLASRLPRLVDDHLVTAHRDAVAVTTQADDSQFQSHLT
jgi:hypothetical protein